MPRQEGNIMKIDYTHEQELSALIFVRKSILNRTSFTQENSSEYYGSSPQTILKLLNTIAIGGVG